MGLLSVLPEDPWKKSSTLSTEGAEGQAAFLCSEGQKRGPGSLMQGLDKPLKQSVSEYFKKMTYFSTSQHTFIKKKNHKTRQTS